MAIAEFFIKPERAEEFLGLMKGALADTRGYEGCEQVDTYVNQDEPGHIVLVEQWRERGNHESYMAWRMEQGMMELLADFVTAPPKFAYYSPRPEV